MRYRALLSTVLLVAAGEVRAQTPGPFVSLSANPGAKPALAPTIDAFFGTKADWNGGSLNNIQSTGGLFTGPTLAKAILNAATINSGTISADISGSSVNGTLLSSIILGIARNQPSGVAGLGADGKIPAALIGALDSGTINGQPIAAAIGAGGSSAVPITDVTGLHVTVNGASALVGDALSSVTAKANAALPTASAGPLATQAGATGSAAVLSALGYTPYNSTNPGGYVTAKTAPVTSVNGLTGAVTIASTGGAAYALPPATPTTLGGVTVGTGLTVASGALSANVNSVFGRTGSITLGSSDIGGALGYTPYNASNPAGYVTAAGASAAAPVRRVVGQTGDITATQIADGLAYQNLHFSIIGNNQNGDQIASSLASTQQTVATIAPLAQGALLVTSNGKEDISVNPVGNSPTSLASLNLIATAKSSTEREFMVNLGMVSGVAQGVPDADKVTIYAGMVGGPGSSNVWASNFLVNSAAGFTGDATAAEFDANNSGADAPLFSSRIVTAFGANGTISGTNNYMTAGIFVGSVASKQIFHYGLALANNAAHDAMIADFGNSDISYLNQTDHASATFADRGASPAAFDAAGTNSIAAFLSQYAHTNVALQMASDQKICMAPPSGCFYYHKATESFVFLNSGGTPVASIDPSGNLILKGSVIQNGTVTP